MGMLLLYLKRRKGEQRIRLSGHLQESSTSFHDHTSTEASNVNANDDHDDADANDEEVDSPIKTKIPLPNLEDVDNETTTANPSRKRLRVRVPISRGEGNHKVTVVRRRPLQPLSGAQRALPAPRRFIVTRVRTPGVPRMTELQSRNKGAESQAEGFHIPRRRVTVTRRRKIQPTSSDEETKKSRVTRKKLVNVRPILPPTPTPTPTPTLAIITTGFYLASDSGDEYSYDDAEDNEEYSEVATKNDELTKATPSLENALDTVKITLDTIDNTLDTIENEPNKIASELHASMVSSTESSPDIPVVLTDHFFLPSEDEEEEYDEDGEEEHEDRETIPPTTEETTSSSTPQPAPPVEPDNMDPSPSSPDEKKSSKTPVTSETPNLNISFANTIKPIELEPASKNSSQSDGVIEAPVANSPALAIPSGINATRTVTSASLPILEKVGTKPPSPVASPLPDHPLLAPAPESTANVYYSETIVTSTRLRTYTYVVTKLNGLETEVTSSTAVRPKVTTLTLTVPVIATPPYFAVATSSASMFSPVQPPPLDATTRTSLTPKNPSSPVYSPETIDDDESAKDEPEDEQGRRFNLATRIMSNGVEVIVAGPTPAPAPRWEAASPPATLTLSDAMVMLMPRGKPQEFVTKTCATTFTYLTTFTDEDGASRVSTQHQVVYNTATEERNMPGEPATPAGGLTLEASPTLGTEVFETTYAYLDLPVDSRGSTVIRNTITAPQHYLDLVLEPSEAPLPETNTYLSTRTMERTITEHGKVTVHAVNDVVTRLVVTESARSPRPTANINGNSIGTGSPEEKSPPLAEVESDVVKTYFVTYSYYSTFLDKGNTVVHTKVATSADVVTEKAPGRRPTTTNIPPAVDTPATLDTLGIPVTPVIQEIPTTSANPEPIQIFATKTYLTTFTYFTTLLQAGVDGQTLTTVSSRSRIVENVVTESIAPSLLDAGYMNALLTTSRPQKDPVDKPSEMQQVNNVVTGSTIIFFDDEDGIESSSTSTPHAPLASQTVDPIAPVTTGSEPRPTTPTTTGEDDDGKVPEESNDVPTGATGSFGTLGPFGSFGINGLSALGPVITAMAGLLQGKTSATRRNSTSDDAQDNQEITTQRSPIYIPVAEFADGDIETAESQNIGNHLANLNRNYIPETRHKSSASLANGIPISPGEVITANSDVIIGKPGKIGGPRPPHTFNRDDEHVGILPPPLPSQALLQPARPHVHRASSEDHGHQVQILPARQVFEEHLKVPLEYGAASSESHLVHVKPNHPQRVVLRTDPGHDVMLNDPLLRPPASPGRSKDRGKPNRYNDRGHVPDPNEPDWSPEKYRRPWSAKDPLKPVDQQEASTSLGDHWTKNGVKEATSSSSKVQGNSWFKQHEHPLGDEKHERPPWAQKDPLLPGNTVVESSLQPKAPEPTSIIRHVVPHVIDRDTGQPLLVNIQPSQVANVVIPQGGNQALIFGDTNEPHITGQYFDDPSPYPEPEVAPGFVGVQKVEHAPQYFNRDDPSEYMVPPPNINYEASPQSTGGRPPARHDRPGHARPDVHIVRDYNQVQRRPASSPATSPPRRTEVETSPHRYILLGKPMDSRPSNDLPGDSVPWILKGDRKPVPPQSATQTVTRPRPQGHFGTAPTRPNSNSHSHNHDVYLGRPGAYPVRKPQYPSAQPSLNPTPPPPPPPPQGQSPYKPQMKKPDANLVPPSWTPPKNPFSTVLQQSQGRPETDNDIIVTITETVPVSHEGTGTGEVLHPTTVNRLRDSEIPHQPDKPSATEASPVQQSTGENLPTGAIGYHDPSTDPNVKPEDTAYYPRVSTVKPEVQSFGQILPQLEDDKVPEIWTVNTQTERSSLVSNDSEISETQKVGIQAHIPNRGDMAPPLDEIVAETNFESHVPLNHAITGISDSFDNVGSVSTVVGKPLEVEQGTSYGQQQQQQKHQQDQNTFGPNREVSFAHQDQEPAIVQGVPFRQDGKRPYEGPMIVKGKPFGVYVDGHVNVARPYGYDQRETRRPPTNHDVVQGVPFGHHGIQKVAPQSTVHEVTLPPHSDNGETSNVDPLLKPPPLTPGPFQHQLTTFVTNRVPGKGNDRPEPTFLRPEIVTMPPLPSPSLSPPAEPGMNKDFAGVNGNQSHPNTVGSGSYYEDESGSELNLAETSYQVPHPVGSVGQFSAQEKIGSSSNGRPNYSHEVARPKPSGYDLPQSQKPTDRMELEFSMPVESTGDDDNVSDTQTERPPSMFSGSTSTQKSPTQLVTLPTSLAAPPPVPEVPVIRKDSMNIHKNDSRPVIKDTIPIPQPRPRPRVPYRDMMPPPMRPTIFHASKITETDNKGQSQGLEPPPLPTEVVGLSPPPPKYIPLEESVTPAARPFLVELLSQDMVPPAPVIETSSRPMPEVETVRPAVAVSGSIRIATAVATPHVPLMQDLEAEIPVVHGTVDLPVIVEMHGPPPTKPSTMSAETKKSEYVSIYTARPFETRPVSSFSHRVSIQPTAVLETNVYSSNTVPRPLRINPVQPSRSSTFSVTIRPTRLSSTLSESVTDDPPTTKRPVRPGRPGKPVLLQPSKDSDTPSLAIKPTQSLASVKPVETLAVTKSPVNVHEAPHSKTTTRVKIPDLQTTTDWTIKDSVYNRTTTEVPRNQTENETVLYVVTTRLPSTSSSTTRTHLYTRTLTSTTVETVTEVVLQPASPTTIISSSTVIRPINRVPEPVHEAPSENESILVVMSDQNPPEPGAEEVEAEYGEEDVEATRDEQDPVGNEIQRVLAGGILGAPIFPREPSLGQCLPECRASKAEVCAEVNGGSKCVCRPGFARMFPDRPCKPIYTYTLRVGLDRVGRDPVSAYAAALNDTKSTAYQKLAGPTKEALDRTMMQSDLRDLYRGLDVARFTVDPVAGVEFHVQFSENANETRLKEVVRKYLAGNNYSLGGTEVYASRDLERVEALDFDECSTEEGGPHHDCSPHAACFNLRGSYQCSCREGWADLSDNLPSYPGRVCSQAPLGCQACNNKGHCVVNTNGQEVCECFPWHSGQRCQVNLKVLLIALVTTGIILLALLGACVGLACLGKPGRRSGNRSGDRRAMIPGGGGGDTSSEGSAADLASIPHHVPHVLPAPPQTVAPAPPSKRPSGAKRNAPTFTPVIPAHPRNSRSGAPVGRPRDSVRSNSGPSLSEDQRDRSLTVMIPRAKYRSAPQSPQSPASCKPPANNLAIDERKLISYLEGGPRPETRKPSLAGRRESVCKEMILDNQQANRGQPLTGLPPAGALVSAGFQVSATVTRSADAESTLARSCGETTVEPSTKILRNSDVLRGDLCSTLARSCGETTIQAPTKLLRLDLGETGSTLARSCGETTIQPQTKMAADRRGSREPRDNASDGHTMAERDVGGTLRMPAQRPPFYDPDRASDRESNFDSL